MKIELKAGKKYGICSCGHSKSLPFCDNAHRQFNANNDTQYKSVKITLDENINVDVTSSNWELDKNN